MMDRVASKSNARRKIIKRREKSHSQLDSLRQQGRAGFPSTIGFVCTCSVRNPGAEDSVFCSFVFQILSQFLGGFDLSPERQHFQKTIRLKDNLSFGGKKRENTGQKFEYQLSYSVYIYILHMIYQSYGSFQRKASFLNAVTSSRRVSPACSTSLFLSRAHVLACSFVEGERHCYHAGNMLRTSHSKSQWYLVKHQCREWTFTCYHYLGLLKGEGLERPIEWSLLDHLRMVDEGEEDGRVCLD